MPTTSTSPGAPRPGAALNRDVTLSGGLGDYRSARWMRNNARRLEFLASLRLPVTSRTVLELGAGIGDHTEYFLDRSCTVTAVEGRAAAVEVLRARFEGIKAVTVREMDLDPPLADDLGAFDVVVCLGLLYHVGHARELLEWAAARTGDLLIVETIVDPAPADRPPVAVEEDRTLPGASTHGTGSRVTRQWVWSVLADVLPHVYTPVGQVPHYEFPLDWRQPVHATTRAIFIGSRHPIADPALVPWLPDQHSWK